MIWQTETLGNVWRRVKYLSWLSTFYIWKIVQLFYLWVTDWGRPAKILPYFSAWEPQYCVLWWGERRVISSYEMDLAKPPCSPVDLWKGSIWANKLKYFVSEMWLWLLSLNFLQPLLPAEIMMKCSVLTGTSLLTAQAHPLPPPRCKFFVTNWKCRLEISPLARSSTSLFPRKHSSDSELVLNNLSNGSATTRKMQTLGIRIIWMLMDRL